MKQLLVSVFALCGKIKVEVSVVTQSLDYSEYRKNRQSSNNNSSFWCVGAAHFAVSWYTVVWLKLISYISVNMWNRLGLVNSPSKSGEYRI